VCVCGGGDRSRRRFCFVCVCASVRACTIIYVCVWKSEFLSSLRRVWAALGVFSQLWEVNTPTFPLCSSCVLCRVSCFHLHRAGVMSKHWGHIGKLPSNHTHPWHIKLPFKYIPNTSNCLLHITTIHETAFYTSPQYINCLLHTSPIHQTVFSTHPQYINCLLHTSTILQNPRAAA
jgi:hypothetical protein